MQRSSIMTQKDPSKGFHKDMIRHISLKYTCSFGKFIPSITWHSLDHDVTKPVFSNGARLLNFSLKILAIKLSAKLSGLSISLARWIKALHAGLFHHFQAMGKTRVPNNNCFSFISFPPFYFENFERYQSFAGHVTYISTKQSVSNATSPNYQNYEVTHALTCLSLHVQCYQLIFVDQKA